MQLTSAMLVGEPIRRSFSRKSAKRFFRLGCPPRPSCQGLSLISATATIKRKIEDGVVRGQSQQSRPATSRSTPWMGVEQSQI